MFFKLHYVITLLKQQNRLLHVTDTVGIVKNAVALVPWFLDGITNSDNSMKISLLITFHRPVPVMVPMLSSEAEDCRDWLYRLTRSAPVMRLDCAVLCVTSGGCVSGEQAAQVSTRDSHSNKQTVSTAVETQTRIQ